MYIWKQAYPQQYRYIWVLAVVWLSACGTSPFDPVYEVEFPPLPLQWQGILGSPHWRITWISPKGTWETVEIPASQGVPPIRVLEEWTSPVIAYPYWPEQGIAPEVMRPAGGLVPFDRTGDRIRLSWRGGVEALVYRELAAHGATPPSGTPRHPHYFNWPRFRALLEGPELHETLRTDLWTADWKAIGLKIAQSGFDKRRLVPQLREELLVPVSYGGPWIGTSPFEEPRYAEAGFLRLQVSLNVDTYLSDTGVLRCTLGTFLWIPR
ncbi:MAG: hypothetical protein LBQ30_10270 [Treponema sp.]|jgi:hypothetical protein|nr:hypothetical protein [Treponema sp.]